MAGSYLHVINQEDGTLEEAMMCSEGQIENLGDAYEAIEEMYGMIWVLALGITEAKGGDPQSYPAELVEWARKNYKNGLEYETNRKLVP